MTRTDKQQKLAVLQAEVAALQAELETSEQPEMWLVEKVDNSDSELTLDAEDQDKFTNHFVRATPIKLPTAKEMHLRTREIFDKRGTIVAALCDAIHELMGIRLELE